MRLLMHICCSNCAVLPLSSMLDKGHGITGLWFNPNIHPEDEYDRRMNAVREMASVLAIDMEYRGGYGLEEFMRQLEESGAGRPGRCRVCYAMRMRETARECASGGYDAFTTSLLISPFQDHDLLVGEAESAARLYGARFHYEDFRPVWKDGQAIARGMGFYRQYYCGCVYSKAERDADRAARAGKVRGSAG